MTCPECKGSGYVQWCGDPYPSYPCPQCNHPAEVGKPEGVASGLAHEPGSGGLRPQPVGVESGPTGTTDRESSASHSAGPFESPAQFPSDGSSSPPSRPSCKRTQGRMPTTCELVEALMTTLEFFADVDSYHGMTNEGLATVAKGALAAAKEGK